MIRQASGRNQRSKVFIVKNVLQVCILVVVFLWLLYQTKLSYDKNKALRENNSRIVNNVAGSHPDVFHLPRKGLTGNNVPASAGDKTPSNFGENEEDVEEEEDQEVRRAMENAEVTADNEGEYEDERESIEEDSSQERHEKIYMGDDASSAVLHANQRTGADDNNSMAQEKDVQTNDTIDIKDDDSKYSNHDAFATSVIAVRNGNNHTNSTNLIGANVEAIRGHSPVDNKPKQQVNSTIASKSHDSVKMQTDPLVVVPSDETARNGTLLMNSVVSLEDPNGVGATEQDHQLQKDML